MKAKLLKLLDVEHDEFGRVGLLFIMSFFMGTFLATLTVASQTLFLDHFADQLSYALLLSGALGVGATIVYNFLQNRIPFPVLAAGSIIIVAAITAFLEFGEGLLDNPTDIYFISFAQLVPFSFIIFLVFWGSFGRLFNLRQAKRLVGTVDIGAMIASFIAYITIFLVLGDKNVDPGNLYTISLISIILYLASFLYLSARHLRLETFAREKVTYRKLNVKEFFGNKYIVYMALFIVASTIAVNFVDYSFLNVTEDYFQNDQKALAKFIALFQAAVVIFCFIFDIVATDRITREYGMRITMLINPVLILIFTVAALVLGFVVGYAPGENTPFFIVFFLIIAISNFFVKALKESLDNPTFKLYLLPIESRTRIDVQTKIEGTVTAFASLIAGGLITLITELDFFTLIYVTIFTIPLLVGWYIVANRMHTNYRYTLHGTLQKSKEQASLKTEKEYTVNRVLEKEVNSTTEEKVIYGLKLMEKLEPTLFENAVTRLVDSDSKKIKLFAEDRIQSLGIEKSAERASVKNLAKQAVGQSEDSDLMSISPEKLMKLSKSVKQSDRMLAAKLLRKLISPKTIFILLELLRDVDPKVRYEALFTARKVKRQETWPVLIEMLGSPSFGHHAAAALKETGESVLSTLEAAFHKSGQSDLVMLRIVQIMGRIGGRYAMQLLWRKADYPDKRIVKQILYSLRYINHQARGREIREVTALLETEVSKTMWNLAALHEIPNSEHNQFLREALKEEIAENYDQITMLLSILYDPQSVQLVRENIESGDPDNLAFALELMDLFVDQELKPKLFPLFDDSSTEQKLETLQVYYPRENYTAIQTINYILNRDFNLSNRWTKVCAIHATAYMPEFRVSRGLAAQMFNRDRLLQETAAWVIHNKDADAYEALRTRLPQRDKNFLDSAIENNQLLDGLDDGFFVGSPGTELEFAL